MKSWFRKRLFKEEEVRQYLTLSIEQEAIGEKVFLLVNNIRIEVSNLQFPLSQEPYMMGIWLPSTSQDKFNHCALEFHKGDQKLLTTQCKVEEELDFEQGRLLILQLVKTNYHFISYLHQRALVAYFYLKRRHAASYRELNHFCAMYSYPRAVIITCQGKADEYNVFPMDLMGYIHTAGLFVLGLRNTNVSLKKMLKSKKVVVCNVAAQHKKSIFSLGKHHSSEAPPIEQLPYTFIQSNHFDFPVPDFVQNYHELEILQSFDKGSHTIMIAMVIHKEQLKPKQPYLYHQHIATAIQLGCDYRRV